MLRLPSASSEASNAGVLDGKARKRTFAPVGPALGGNVVEGLDAAAHRVQTVEFEPLQLPSTGDPVSVDTTKPLCVSGTRMRRAPTKRVGSSKPAVV